MDNEGMNVYVLGAGASYPLGTHLLQKITEYISSTPGHDRFDYQTWPDIMAWIADNPNPLLRQAYRNGNIEQIFTILDLADSLHDESMTDILRAAKKGMEAVTAAERAHAKLAKDTADYQRIKHTLLWAMDAYFQHRHSGDYGAFKSEEWRTLRGFGELLQPGDVVVTFNYDSTVERVLLDSGKWSPADGYGAKIVFQKAITFPASPVKVLHLHGAVGWYRKPAVRADYPLGEGGAIPREALTPAPLGTKISLDPIVLHDFGIYAVDASLPDRPPDEAQILLHPSFLKDYGGEDTGNPVFIELWKTASEALRSADKIVIVGYSLPPADSAAWTLLLTTCDRTRTSVVDPSSIVMRRYQRLLRLPQLRPAQYFADWITSQKH